MAGMTATRNYGSDFTIVVDSREALAEIMTLQQAYARIINDISPIFGAFMPYSYYAEYFPYRDGPRKAVETAVLRNMNLIANQINDRLLPLLDRAVRSKSTAGLRKGVESAWEDVLNGTPKAEAQAMARVYTGMHRSTISAYATQEKANRAFKAGESLNRQREAARSRAGLGGGT